MFERELHFYISNNSAKEKQLERNGVFLRFRSVFGKFLGVSGVYLGSGDRSEKSNYLEKVGKSLIKEWLDVINIVNDIVNNGISHALIDFLSKINDLKSSFLAFCSQFPTSAKIWHDLKQKSDRIQLFLVSIEKEIDSLKEASVSDQTSGIIKIKSDYQTIESTLREFIGFTKPILSKNGGNYLRKASSLKICLNSATQASEICASFESNTHYIKRQIVSFNEVLTLSFKELRMNSGLVVEMDLEDEKSDEET